MSEWSRMSEEEKAEYCRASGCDFYFPETDDCMYPENDLPFLHKKCEDLQRGE